MNGLGSTSVNFERKGYARGLILGLTMAETMLLLVFCLLLAAGAIISKKEKETQAALKAVGSGEERVLQAELEKSKAENERERLLAEVGKLMRAATGRPIPDDDWDKLVTARNAAAAIAETGLTLEEAVEYAAATKVLRDNAITEEMAKELVSAMKKLANHGISPEQAAAMAESMKALKDSGYAEKTAAELTAALFKAADGDAKPHEWPPIISLSELEGYNFRVGSAELSETFRTKLKDKSAEIAETAKQYRVDIIEVIGHTDEQVMAGDYSNMDSGLKPVLDGEKPIGSLHPADNAGLGLARAISVAELLERLPELDGFTILPMSGGQLILPGDRLTDGAQRGDVKARRRIEIRVRKRSEQQTTKILPHSSGG